MRIYYATQYDEIATSFETKKEARHYAEDNGFFDFDGLSSVPNSIVVEGKNQLKNWLDYNIVIDRNCSREARAMHNTALDVFNKD